MAWQTPKTNWGQAGQTVPVADDFNRIEENIRVLEAADSLPTTTGTAPNYLVTIPDFIGLKVGRQITIKFHAATSGQAATLNANSLGAKPIIKPGGGNPNIKAGAYNLVYDGANFQLLGEGGEYGTAQAQHVLSPYTIGTENGIVQGTIPSKGPQIYVPGTTDQAIGAGQYLTGIQTIKGDPNLLPENIKSGVSIFGKVGTLQPAQTGSIVYGIDTQPYGFVRYSGGTVYVYNNLVEVEIPYYGSSVAGTDIPIDLTPYKGIYAEISVVSYAYAVSVGLQVRTTKTGSSVRNIGFTGADRRILDVSDLTGLHYVCLSAYITEEQSSTLRVRQLHIF